MNILVIGGTRFFGIHMVRELVKQGHQVTIATRGQVEDDFGSSVNRIKIDRTNEKSIEEALGRTHYDVICDNIAYCSNDVKNLLDTVKCNRYVMTSTMSVYDLHTDIKEEDFNPLNYNLKWCQREDYTYDEIKRQAECALFQQYSDVEAVAVRFPFVIGADDYTKRLYFYVEHTIKGIPMYIDNLRENLGFIRSDEAGKFLAFLAGQDYTGILNGCSNGTITINEVISYVENKTGRKAIIDNEGEKAPYNRANSYSINTDKATKLGFRFTDLNEWIYDLLDKFIEDVLKEI